MARILKHYLVTCILLAVAPRPLTSESETGDTAQCEGTQYIEYGGTATVQCHFPDDFYGVYWYNSANVDQTPVISLKESKIKGDGYTSGEFNIHPNGSLIINKVTFEHNQTFSVTLLLTKDGNPIVSRIDVIVKGGTEGCDSTQYLEYGKVGIVQCFFTNYFGVYWYNSTAVNRSPMLLFEESEKTGDGYSSNEFDVHPNGSLVINNVTLRHDHILAVNMMRTRDADPFIMQVSLVVTAYPTVLHPVIDHCQNIDPCLIKVENKVDLYCHIHGIRPAVDLFWWSVGKSGKVKITSEQAMLAEGIRYNSYANISNLNVQNINLITCEANDTASLLNNNASIILIEPIKHNEASQNVLTVDRFVRNGTNISLECINGHSDALFTLWRKTTKTNETSDIVLSALGLQTFYNQRYLASRDGALAIDGVKIADEGIYSCIAGDSLMVQKVRHNMTVVVNPTVSSPVIDECKTQRKCEILLEDSVMISCSVRGIRPVVELEWNVKHDTQNEVISLEDTKLNVLEKADGTFDVFIKSLFRKIDNTIQRLDVTCKATDYTSKNVLPENFSRDFTLVFSKDLQEIQSSTTDVTDNNVDAHGNGFPWYIYVISICPTTFIIGYILWNIKGKLLQDSNTDGKAETSSGSADRSSLSTEMDSLIGQSSDDNNQNNRNKNSFEDLRESIGLGKWMMDGLISKSKTQSGEINDAVVSTFFSRLLTEDIEVIKLLKEVFQSNLKAEEVKINEGVLESVIGINNHKSQEAIQASCRDILFAIIHSCDPNLRKEIIFNISLRNTAVPLLLPEPGNLKVACLLSDFENISKNWKAGSEECEKHVTVYPFPSIAAVRIGELRNCSKSSILNTLLGKVQGNHNRTFFYSHNEDNYYSHWSNGTVEAAWFLPNGNSSKEEYVLSKEMCVLNHRGPLDIEGTSVQEQFLNKFATCVLIFVSGPFLVTADAKIDSICRESESDVILVISQGGATTEVTNLQCFQRKNLTIIDVKGRYSEMSIAEEICKSLRLVLQNNECKSLEQHGRKLCQDLGLNLKYNGTTRSRTGF